MLDIDNPWQPTEDFNEAVRQHLDACIVQAGVLACAESDMAPELAITTSYCRRMVFALCAHSEAEGALASLKATAWEFARLINSRTAPGAHVDSTQCEHGGEHAFTLDVAHVFMEQAIEGNLRSAVNVVDALVAEHGEVKAFNDGCAILGDLVFSLGLGVHMAGHGDEENEA